MTVLDLIHLFWLLAFALFLSVSLNLALLCGLTRRRRHAKLRARLLTAGVATGLTFFALEFFFAYVYVPTDGFEQTLAARLWAERHWKPLNALGYRDHPDKAFVNHRTLFVVGDSFVSGHGIRNVKHRFAEQLDQRLGHEWEFAIIAQNGWNSETEYRHMAAYPAQPDAILLSHYVNDIHGAAADMGEPPRQYHDPIPTRLAWFTNKSFFLNWAYWRLVRGRMGDDYWPYLQQCYADPEIWNKHAQILTRFIDYARERGAPLYVVLWPHLGHVEASRAMNAKVSRLFAAHNVPVLDLIEHLASRPTEDLILNPLDVHANKELHTEVAELLYQLMHETQTNAMAARRTRT
jgi:hypothetical protein